MRKPKGTGLGLAICNKILDLHRGQIDVTSEVNMGAKFSFSFPMQLDSILKEENTEN